MFLFTPSTGNTVAFSIAGGAGVVRSASVWNRMGGFKELRHIDLH